MCITSTTTLFEMDCKKEVEVLTDSLAARGMVRRSGCGRVKHLEARWLWLQERTRAKVLHVVTVATALNSADLSTKFNPGRRFDELLMMFLLRIGVGMGLLWHVWRCVRLRLHVQALCKVRRCCWRRSSSSVCTWESACVACTPDVVSEDQYSVS